MIRFLRRYQPRNPVLVVLYWAALTIIVLAVLFYVFFLLDNFLPAMF